MNTKELARDKYQLVTKLADCPFDEFWVVLLDDSTEIYDSAPSPSHTEQSAWMRLKSLCQETGRKILHMAYAYKNNPSAQINCQPMQDGYFFSKRISKLMAADPSFSGYSDEAIGVGYEKNALLHITWRTKDGYTEQETRNLSLLDSRPFNIIKSNA